MQVALQGQCLVTVALTFISFRTIIAWGVFHLATTRRMIAVGQIVPFLTGQVCPITPPVFVVAIPKLHKNPYRRFTYTGQVIMWKTSMGRAVMTGYKAFSRGKEIEVCAETSYAAQVKAAKQFKARYMNAVAVELFEENVLVDGYENAARHSKQVFSRNDD